MPDFTQFLQLINVATNLSIVVVGIKLVRHLTRMEFKLDLMWQDFKKKFHLVEGAEDVS